VRGTLVVGLKTDTPPRAAPQVRGQAPLQMPRPQGVAWQATRRQTHVQEPSISAAGPSGAGGPPSAGAMPPRGGEAEKAETRGTKKDSYHMYQSVSRTWRLRIRESVFMVYAIIDTVKWNSVSRHNFGTLHVARCTLHAAR
jgi:hypothetical protein